MDFKDNHKIQIMLSKHLKGKAPLDWDKSDWKQFYKTFQKTELTPYQLAAMIWQGYSFTPVYARGRRKEENFLSAWHMAFDFDSEGAALSHLMQDGSTAQLFSSFAYSTPSSTPEQPKSRVVFIFDEPLDTPELTREVYQAIAWRFKKEGSVTDPSCKDPLRLYYGSPNCEVVGNWSIVTTKSFDDRPSMVDFFINEYRVANPIPQPAPPDPTTTAIPPSAGFVETAINKLLDHIVQAPDGEKHSTLNKISYTLGGYVASGYLSETEAVSRAEQAIRQNGRAKDLQSAIKTIQTAVSDGQAGPIVLERQYKNNLDMLL